MSSIAILYICTGKYSVLWREFYESTEKYLCADCSKDYYVFTDAEKLEHEDENERIHKYYQMSQPWPYPTLLRFKMFLRVKDELKKYDYVFFFNANAEMLVPITRDMILPRREKHEKLVVAKHPTYNWSRAANPFDRNPLCRAYVPHGIGKLYVQASIIGGTSKAFLKMTKKLSRQIDRDLKHNIIALWHDESYVNRYILFRHDFRLLGHEYVRQHIFDGKKNLILMRPKENYFDVGKVKENPPMTQLSHFWQRFDDYSRNYTEKITLFIERHKNKK